MLHMERAVLPKSGLAHDVERRETLAAAGALPRWSHLSIVSNAHGLAALRQHWQALETESCAPLSVFQSFAWNMAWSEVYAKPDSAIGLHVIVGYDDGQLVFVWPLMHHKMFGLRVLSWLTEPFGQYGDIICARDQCPRLWVANSLRYLKELGGFDILRLRHVRADSALATVAKGELIDAKLHERAPWLDLTAFKNDADYEARYTSAQRKRRKKIRKHLEEIGPVTFVAVKEPAAIRHSITNALDEKTKWLAERGRMNRVIDCPGHADFIAALERNGQQGLETVVSVLSAGGKPVSWEIGFRYGGRHFAYITSHVNALTDFSPGRLHMDYSQREALKAGMSAFDLMVPYDAHKESWSSACAETQDYFLPFTFPGSIAGKLYLRQLRPLLRAVYYRLPAPLLRLVNRGRAE
jgi:CelD/BcsL family acetyltransferase involved in cellulose biosynthesis